MTHSNSNCKQTLFSDVYLGTAFGPTLAILPFALLYKYSKEFQWCTELIEFKMLNLARLACSSPGGQYGSFWD